MATWIIDNGKPLDVFVQESDRAKSLFKKLNPVSEQRINWNQRRLEVSDLVNLSLGYLQ